jgi:hypothetical protein
MAGECVWSMAGECVRLGECVTAFSGLKIERNNYKFPSHRHRDHRRKEPPLFERHFIVLSIVYTVYTCILFISILEYL